MTIHDVDRIIVNTNDYKMLVRDYEEVTTTTSRGPRESDSSVLRANCSRLHPVTKWPSRGSAEYGNLLTKSSIAQTVSIQKKGNQTLDSL